MMWKGKRMGTDSRACVFSSVFRFCTYLERMVVMKARRRSEKPPFPPMAGSRFQCLSNGAQYMMARVLDIRSSHGYDSSIWSQTQGLLTPMARPTSRSLRAKSLGVYGAAASRWPRHTA